MRVKYEISKTKLIKFAKGSYKNMAQFILYNGKVPTKKEFKDFVEEFISYEKLEKVKKS